MGLGTRVPDDRKARDDDAGEQAGALVIIDDSPPGTTPDILRTLSVGIHVPVLSMGGTWTSRAMLPSNPGATIPGPV